MTPREQTPVEAAISAARGHLAGAHIALQRSSGRGITWSALSPRERFAAAGAAEAALVAAIDESRAALRGLRNEGLVGSPNPMKRAAGAGEDTRT